MSDVAHSLEMGAEFPFDAPDERPGRKDVPPPPAEDWAHAAARGVIADLQDRRGIKREFEGLDYETRVIIVSSLTDIIRLAASRASDTPIIKVQEAGPWKAGETADGSKAYVESDDFTHDVRLYVVGDFEDGRQRMAYAEEIAGRLNESVSGE